MNHKLIVNLVFSFSSSRNQMFVCFFLFFNTVLKQLLDFDQENAMDSTPAGSLYFLSLQIFWDFLGRLVSF